MRLVGSLLYRYSAQLGFSRKLVASVVDDLRVGLFSLLANTLAGSAVVPRVVRLLLLRAAGLDIAAAQVRPGVIFTTPRVRLGPGVFVNRNCLFDSQAWITLGAEVHVGHSALLCTSTHELGSARHRAGSGYALPMEVKEGCWIGAPAVLLPGIVVGEGCVIASGAVVTADCAPNGLYAGVPARRIRDLD